MTRDQRRSNRADSSTESVERVLRAEDRRDGETRQQHVSIDAAPELFE